MAALYARRGRRYNSQIYSRQTILIAFAIRSTYDGYCNSSNGGKVTRGRIGGISSNQSEAESFGLPKPAGALVTAVGPEVQPRKLDQVSEYCAFDGSCGIRRRLVRFVGNKSQAHARTASLRGGKLPRFNVTIGEMPDDRTAGEGPRRGAPGKPAPDAAT